MRDVQTVDSFDDAFFLDLDALSSDCATGVYFFLEALESEEPEIAEPNDDDCELCGVIDLRYEVFCATIPGCRTYRMFLTIDRKQDVVFVHSVQKGRKRNCAEAYRISAMQLSLESKPWEPRHDENIP